MGIWSIEAGLFNWMRENLDKGKIILEFGSGNMTKNLCNFWNVYSIEENKDWTGKFHNQYIYAPIVDNWYDMEVLKKELPKKADLILVDGPAHGARTGFNENFEILKIIDLEADIYVFDDVERAADNKCYLEIVKILKKNGCEIETDIDKAGTKNFAYIKIKTKN